MKKIISIILGISILATCVTCVFADEKQAKQNIETEIEATTQPVEPDVSATVLPEESATPTLEPTYTPVPTPSPTSSPTPTPAPTPAPKISPFFCAMKNGSKFVYTDAGNSVKYVPMLSSTNIPQTPMVINNRTYLPFRYIFEELFGFKDKARNQDNAITIELDNNEYTYGYENNTFEIRYKFNNAEYLLIMDEEKKVTDPRNGKSENMAVLKIVDDSSYLPLVYFADNGLCSIGYDASSKDIYIADNDKRIEKYSKILSAREYTNNFITEADTVMKNNTVLSVSNETDSWCCGASNNFNFALFQDMDNRLYHLDLYDGRTSEVEFKDDTGMVVDIMVDRAVIYGDRIFGLKVSDDNRIAGQLFEATLDVKDINYADNSYKVCADNFNTIINNNVVMYNLQEELNGTGEILPIIYYVDIDQDYKLRRLDVNSGSVTDVTVNGKPITKADYFAIGEGYLVYNDFAERKIKAFRIDGGGNIKTLADLGNMDIQFIVFDGIDSFYYIQTGSEPNEIKKITLTDGNFGSFETYFKAEPSDESYGRIRNISAFDGRIYANVNNYFMECKQGDN